MSEIKIKKVKEGKGVKQSHCNPKNFRKEYTLITKEFRIALRVRVYETPNTSYCCVFDDDFGGSSKSTGYGFHKESAAVQYAFEEAGYDVTPSIDGRGNSAILESIDAYAEYKGIKDYFVNIANG